MYDLTLTICEKLARHTRRLLLVTACAGSGFASALSFDAGPTEFDGAWGSGHQGQAFTPAENADPAPTGGVAYLQQMEFTRGGTVDANTGDVETYVDIYEPTGATLATSTLIGSSITAQDTTDTVDGTIYTFQFDNLALVSGTTYVAVFRNAADALVPLNLRQSFEPTVAANIGGPYDYVGGGAVFDYDVSGWASDTNLDFTALYSDLAPTAAATFTGSVTQLWGQWSTGIQGQAFVPRTNATPNPVGTPSTVFLQSMRFTLGGFDINLGDSATTLDILLPGPTLATSTVVGSSTNVIDTTNPPGDEEDDFGNPPIHYLFEFDDLELFYNATYLAVFRNGSGQVIALDVEQGFEGNDLFPGDVPRTVGGGGIFDYDSFGWAEETNADYVATFATASVQANVPAMGWIGLAVLGASLSLAAWSRRRVY